MARHTAKSHKIRKVEILVIQILIYQAVNFENFFEKLLTPTQRNSLRYVYREEEMTMMTVNEVSKLTGISWLLVRYIPEGWS